MKKLIILLTILGTLYSCKVNKKPEFLGVKNIEVLEANSQFVKLKADALFKNPNNIKGKLKTDGIKVFVNDKEMAKVISDEFEVPAKNEFTIPLQVNISTDSLISNESIGGLLSSLISQKIKVNYKGDLKYKVLGFSHRYKIDKTEDVKIKL